MKQLNILVLGLGNILLGDEGVGVHAVNAIREKCSFPDDVEIMDGGTLGLDLLPRLENRDKVLIIDAVDFRKEPGHIGVLEDDEIPSALFAKLSVHHIGLSDLLYAAKLMDIVPSKIRLIGIQPQSIDVGLAMTDCIRDKMNELIDLALKTLKEWNRECVLPSPQESFQSAK
jgi:hydrogenase maturation protease